MLAHFLILPLSELAFLRFRSALMNVILVVHTVKLSSDTQAWSNWVERASEGHFPQPAKKRRLRSVLIKKQVKL